MQILFKMNNLHFDLLLLWFYNRCAAEDLITTGKSN